MKYPHWFLNSLCHNCLTCFLLIHCRKILIRASCQLTFYINKFLKVPFTIFSLQHIRTLTYALVISFIIYTQISYLIQAQTNSSSLYNFWLMITYLVFLAFWKTTLVCKQEYTEDFALSALHLLGSYILLWHYRQIIDPTKCVKTI